MSYILTPAGRKSLISESKKSEVNETIELDVDHFVNYVMENFPELTENYIKESTSGKTLKDYPHLHKHVMDKQKTDKLPPKFTHNIGDTPVHPKTAAAHSKADSALASGHSSAKRRASDVYRNHYGYEGSAERITSK